MADKADADDIISSYPFSDDESPETEEEYVCEDCGREFSNKRGLNIHRGQQHEDEE